MTVIAWDGTTLAADRLADVGGSAFATTKIERVRGCLVGYAGLAAAGEELLAWFADGADANAYPPSLRTHDSCTRLLVIPPDGPIRTYESSPYPVKFDRGIHAIGSGRDHAMTAMYLGHSARAAVEVTIALCANCGMGVDTLTFGEPNGNT